MDFGGFAHALRHFPNTAQTPNHPKPGQRNGEFAARRAKTSECDLRLLGAAFAWLELEGSRQKREGRPFGCKVGAMIYM